MSYIIHWEAYFKDNELGLYSIINTCIFGIFSVYFFQYNTITKIS